MYILPKNDAEFLDLCDIEQFKGRHNVIMAVKQLFDEYGYETINKEDFIGFVKFHNKNGWEDWC